MKQQILTQRTVVRVFAPALLLMIAATFLSGCVTPPTARTGMGAVPAGTMSQNESESLVLRAGDVVKVSFPGAANLDTTQQIRRDGKITMPLIGEVTAAGLTPETLQAQLITKYAPQISSKQVIVTVDSSAFPVFVTGFVMHPGKVVSNHPITALEAIMEAGGFNYTSANLKDVRVIRNVNGVMTKYSLNLKRVLAGERSHPFYLQPSDIVYVPERFSFF